MLGQLQIGEKYLFFSSMISPSGVAKVLVLYRSNRERSLYYFIPSTAARSMPNPFL
jgi:hypothetical protein